MGDPENNVKRFRKLKRVMDPMMEAVQSTETGPVQDGYQLAGVHLRKEYAAYVFAKPKHTTMGIVTWAKSMNTARFSVWNKRGLEGSCRAQAEGVSGCIWGRH